MICKDILNTCIFAGIVHDSTRLINTREPSKAESLLTVTLACAHALVSLDHDTIWSLQATKNQKIVSIVVQHKEKKIKLSKVSFIVSMFSTNFLLLSVTIDSLYKVTEGGQSDIFLRHPEGSFNPACCFTVYHGNHMESLDLVTSNSDEARTWITGLRYLMAGISDEDSLAKRQRTHDQYP